MPPTLSKSVAIGLAAGLTVGYMLYRRMKQQRDDPTLLKVVTWNIAGVNNNPFEYYTAIEGDERYATLMAAVQDFMVNPGARDVQVREVFTPAMWVRLREAMEGLGWKGVDKVAALWESDYSTRTIVGGFLKDKDLGAKRLASMPDRFTNTINTADGGVVCRPTVINNYTQPMPDGEAWFAQWFAFFFETPLTVRDKKGKPVQKKPCEMLAPIKKAKYPAISSEEERISLPLQLLCQAIFDAVLVHAMNTLAPGAWQQLKERICAALVVDKSANTLAILQREHADADVVFLQEVSTSLAAELRAHATLGARFAVLEPDDADPSRDQNSLVLVAKRRLAGEPEEMATRDAASAECWLAPDAPVAPGDLALFSATLRFGPLLCDVLLASFHGDTNGLASDAVVDAMRAVADHAGGLPIVAGLDANTHAKRDAKGAKAFVGDFVARLPALGLAHAWAGEPSAWLTTCNARTFLQPQLNKAVKVTEKLTSPLADVNPKDFILFSSGEAFEVAAPATKDNTGVGKFIDGLDMPSLTFPSDHAIVTATLRAVQPSE